MKAVRTLVAAVVAFAGSFVSAQTCTRAPIASADQAICLARQFADREKALSELEFEAKERKSYWMVHYRPKSPQVRGGAGDLKVNKQSGEVTFLKGYR